MKSFSVLILFFVFGTVLISSSLNYADGYSFVGVTSNGVEFPINIETSSTSNSTSSATSNAQTVSNAFGVYSNIYTNQKIGQVFWGNGILGTAEPLTPYIPTNSSSNFGAVILETDTINTYQIPEFWRTYNYANVSLVDVTQTSPNLLGYSESRTTVGSAVSSISDGINVSGTGEIIFKLNDYSNQSLILRGDSGIGDVKIITSSIDLMGATYTPGFGYLSHSGGNPGTNGISIVAGSDSTHKGEFDYSVYHPSYWVNYSCRGGCIPHGHTVPAHTSYHTSTSTLVQVNNVNHMLVTGHTNTGSISAFRLYDTLPSVEKIGFSSEIFETNFQFPNEQSYLYVKPNGGTVTIKAEESVNIPIVQISNLPSNTPYEISKDGWIGAVGITSETGTITLYDSEVNFEGFTTQGGLLHLYPDSMSYRGAFTTLCFDTENKEIFHVPGGRDEICVPSAFVKLPISMDVELKDLSSGNVPFDYLIGNKTAGDSISAPILPKMKTLSFTLNDLDAVINIADITNTAQTKVLSAATDSATLYSTSGAVENMEVNVSNTVAQTATHTGTMNVALSLTHSAESTFTVNSDYSTVYTWPIVDCVNYDVPINCVGYSIQTASAARGHVYYVPLDPQDIYDGMITTHAAALENAINAQGAFSIYANIVVNGEYVDSVLIYQDIYPTLIKSSDLGLVSVQNAKVVYSQTTTTETISLDVEAGDYVEFIINAGITVSGIPTPINSDVATVAGFASGTVTIHSGSITATMG